MKITGTKKLLIILASLVFTAAAGLGVLFGGLFHKAPKVYAQTSMRALSGDEDKILEEFSEISGFAPELLKFYAKSNGGTVEMLYQNYLYDEVMTGAAISEFLNSYSQGELTNENIDDMADEDWFVAPDEVSEYNFNACPVGVADSWTEWYTSKSFITNDEEYWRNPNFQYGHLTISAQVGVPISGSYATANPVTGVYWDSNWAYDIVWLEEGEEFEFGIKSVRGYNQRYVSAMSSEYFINNYMSDKKPKVLDLDYPKKTSVQYYTATFKGAFTDGDENTPVADTDPCKFGYDSPATNRGDWKEEFRSDISPVTTGADGGTNNTKYAAWTSDSAGHNGTYYNAGVYKIKVSADAPSGMYFMTLYHPYVGGYRGVWRGGLATTTWLSPVSCAQDGYHSTGWVNGAINYSNHMNYGVLVCRKGVSAPVAEYGEGVSPDLTSKTINYTGQLQTFTLTGDWGPGLSTIKTEKWDKGTNSWVSTINLNAKWYNPATPATLLDRTIANVAGKGVAGNTVFTATTVGKYKITYTPFRNWSDGTTAPKEYFFEVKPMLLKKTTLVQEEGVTQATNTKFVYATGNNLYVSLYPVSQQWASASYPGLSKEVYSTSGVLTLSGKIQNDYTITVSLVDPVNTAWDDGTDYGSIANLTFTFTIGPEKIVVPDIIQDTGQIGAFKKEVIFNGAFQTMSFLPIRTYQLNILVENVDTGEILSETSAADRVGYVVSDNTLVVRAFDAGHYKITLTVKPEYIFEEMSTTLEYELIIYEAEIDAPEFDENVAGTVKTVTFGGERVIIDDEGKTQTWYATLSFTNANESLINFKATDGLNQLDWGNSKLILSARPAGTYYVNFYPNKNYKWKSGVTSPQYTLIIERLKIAKPVLVNDKEAGADFKPASNPTLKSIGFDGNEHSFTISFPTLEGTNTQYTKKSSILLVHTGSFDDVWAPDGNSVSFNASEAAAYTFTMSPSSNYCWPDGSTSDVVLVFEIVPVTIDALQMWVGTAQDYEDEELEQIEYATNGDGYMYRFFYDGGEKVVRIGDAGAVTPQRKYVTDDDKFSKYFFLLDDDGGFVGGNEEGASKLLPGMTVKEDDGYLTIWAVEAGTYRIGVFIKNTNYRWAENNQTMVVYTLIIEAKSLPQPIIDESASQGHAAQFEKQIGLGTYTMNDIYALINFEFVITLDKAEYFDYISITDMGGVVYEHVEMTDVEVKNAVNNALSEDGAGYFVYWNPAYKSISFFARDFGDYTWTIKITNGNYKWSNTTAEFLTYKLSVKRSPVSGLEMRYIGDSKEMEETTADGAEGKLVGYEGAWGADPEAKQALLVYKTTFSDEEKEFFFKRTNTANLVNTGFNEQYSYEIRPIAVVEGTELRSLEEGGRFVFNETELRLSALDAGTYEIAIKPTYNYCWNDNAVNVGTVTFKLIVERLLLDRPLIIDDDGSEMSSSIGEKTTQFNHDYQTFALSIKNFPQGYAIKDFVYYDTENRVGVDWADVKTSGEYTDGGFTKNLGLDIKAKTVAVQAKSAGDYGLKITVSNPNNYYLADGDLEFTYHITKLQIMLPQAYLSTQVLDATEANNRDVTYDMVDGSASVGAIGQKTLFNADNFYQVNATYNGTYFAVYFYGGDVSKGDFFFTVTTKDNYQNGVDLMREIHPDYDLDFDLGKAGYFRLAATSVNEYIISLTFTSRDFYWSDSSIDDSESGVRTFTFIINKNSIDMPEITGFENQPLLNESYKADFKYELDPLTGEPVSRTIELEHVFLGAEVNTDGVFVYSNITVTAGANATPGGVHISVTPDISDSTYGTITFSTAEDGVISGALVTYIYYIELSINPLNSEWSTGDKSANKLFYIIINAMEVTNPRLGNSDVQGVQMERHATYTGDVFNDALIITGFDSLLMNYSPSPNLTPAGASAPDITVSGTQINVKAPAPVEIYSVTVELLDTDNTAWKNGETGPLVFFFIVDRIKVAKPYIENSAKETSVVGLTKTVTYVPGTAQFIEIVNYWFNPAALDPSGTPPFTDDGTVTLSAPVPEVMSFSIANADPEKIVYSYNQVSGAYQSMKYNDFNNGYLKMEATDAGRYTIRFTLSNNAVWIDESTEPIDVTLVIKKIEIDDLIIVGGDSEASISADGFIKTIMYKLDGSGNAIDRVLQLKGFDNSLMTLDETAATWPANVTGYSKISVDGGTDNGYEFTAKLAGEYVFRFVLNDGDNYRWKYANTDEISFTLKIAPLELQVPVIYTDYRLVNESIDAASRTLSVDYDLHEHTLIVQSLFERLKNGDYSGLGATHYFTVNNTSYDDGTLDEPTHKSELNAYDDTSDSGRTVKDLFDILGLGTYDLPDKDNAAAQILNAFTLTAYTPGTYTITFKLVDDNNMVWFDNGVRSTEDIVFTLIIDKVKHEAPAYMPGESNTKQYDGGDVTFSLVNLYNGINEPNSTTVTSTVSEKYTVEYIDGEDTTVMAGYVPGDKRFEESWYNGKLTLKFRAVGTYKVTVEISDPDNIEWAGTTDTSRTFNFTVAKRQLTTSITFAALNDADVNTELQKGSTNWYISTQVRATIVIRGLKEIPSGAIDKDLKFKIFYEISTDVGTEIEALDLTGSSLLLMQAGPFADGTYSLTVQYNNIHYGRGNVVKGAYTLHIEQDDEYVNAAGMHSNYVIPDPELAFTIDADPAPFKTDMLEWYYERSDMAGILVPITGIGGDPDNRFSGLTFKEGVTFTFHLKLNTKGMNGYEGGPYSDMIDALNSWKVDWDGVTYGGDRIVSAAGNHQVSVNITALDPNEFSYNEPPFTLYYTIQKANYNLSDLSWDYNADEPFEFDGTIKNVAIVGLGTAYPGLSVSSYETEGTFKSGGNSYNVPASTANDGGMIYAGVYKTTVYFQVPVNSNYNRPVKTNAGSYEGTFVWTLTWEIKPQEIEVEWVETNTTNSNGDSVSRTSPAIAAPHSNKFKYTYERWDSDEGVWVSVNEITRKPDEVFLYRATPYLDSTPTVPSTDFARNYKFKVLGDNPLEFTVGGNDVKIINHIEINGKTDNEYEYTGNPFVAKAVIDLDTTNGLINDPDKMWIDVIYYNVATPDVTFTDAPVEPGTYVAVMKLNYVNATEDYALLVPEFEFTIIKAKIKYSDFEWRFDHDDGNGLFTAKLDDSGNWVKVDTNEIVEMDYNGRAYKIYLWAEKYSTSVIDFFYTENNEIDADQYKATITPTLDEDHYQLDSTDKIPDEYDWEIVKHKLDLSEIAWDYEKAYEFTLVNDTPKAFSPALKNVPSYLTDKIIYKVERNTGSGYELVTSAPTDSGKYRTTVSIDEDAVDFNNYELETDTWPSSVSKVLNWEIKRKELSVPVDDRSWKEFNGLNNNLLAPFKLAVDWEEYFSVEVEYAPFDGGFSEFDGMPYGGKYFAYNAGIYRFTFKVNKSHNTDSLKNIVWIVNSSSVYTATTEDQVVSYTVDKKVLTVVGWNPNYESSTVILEGGINPTRFIDYEFYRGEGKGGQKVGLDVILSSAGGEQFSMAPVLKNGYEGNIILKCNPSQEYTSFLTKKITADNATLLTQDKPTLLGYTIGTSTKPFTTADYDTDGVPFVIYTGQEITFVIRNWEGYYQNYLTVWNGSLDDLTQTDVNDYSITLILRTDLDKPLYWGINSDNTLDRAPVTLKFRIKYRTLTIPTIPDEITYTGSEIDILSKVSNTTLAKLLAEYGEYVAIDGRTATDVGSTMLRLTIKPEYGASVRWSDGTADAKAMLWTITPILFAQPVKNESVTIVYDGNEHSVFEFLNGYSDNPSEYFKNLMQLVKDEASRTINAGTYTAKLSLPNSNYAWCDESGNIVNLGNTVSIEWTIDKLEIDFGEAYWGYYDSDNTPQAYDAEKPFVYTVKNGASVVFTVQLFGMPEILKLFASYNTDGTAGNSASAVGDYVTYVEYDLSNFDWNNYIISSDDLTYSSQLSWKIVAREFETPTVDNEDNKIKEVYDGTVRDIIEMLGLIDDWAEYFDVKVEYKETDGGTYTDYAGSNMSIVGYSNYKIFYVGFYRITITLKAKEPVWSPGTNLIWKDGEPAPFVIEIAEREIVVTKWNEDNQYSTAEFEGGELPAAIAEKLEYVVYEEGDIDKTPVAPEDIQGGKTYYIELRIKSGSNADGIPYSYGIILNTDAVNNPLEFGSYDYGTQPIFWIPIPVLETAVMEYNGKEQEFRIVDFDKIYKLTDLERTQLNYIYPNLKLDVSVKSYAYLQNANSLKATAAGEYSAVVRLQSKIRLSWYDPELYYTVSGDLSTLYYKNTTTPVTDADSLYNSKSIVLNFRITPKKIPLLSDEDLEMLIDLVVQYNGTEKEVTVDGFNKELDMAASEIFAKLEAKYGSVFNFDGTKGTIAGVYELLISIADIDSCSWYNPDETELKDKKINDIGGYRLEYVFEDGVWSLKLIKVDENGNLVKDSAGNYVEYFDEEGNYTIDAKYQPVYQIEDIAIDGLLNPDGSLNTDNPANKFFNDGNEICAYTYITDENGNPVQYYWDGSEYQVADGVTTLGTHLMRYKLEYNDSYKEYGYKVPVTEDDTAYYYLFSKLSNGANGKVPDKDAYGNYIDVYLAWNNTTSSYELRKYTVVDGEFVLNSDDEPEYTVLMSVANGDFELDGVDSYSIKPGTVIFESNASGKYMKICMLESDGSRKKRITYLTDEFGNYVIAQDGSVILVEAHEEVAGVRFVVGKDENGGLKVEREDVEDGSISYVIEWTLDSSSLPTPKFDEENKPEYTGKKIYAKDYLIDFDPLTMEIVEDSFGIDADEYYAKIRITTENSKWADTDDEYVTVTWSIAKAKLDLSEVKWVYRDANGTYEDDSNFIYTRKDGVPVIYWVELANLPTALKGKVVYTTNKRPGAYAGTDAGKYETSYDFKTDDKNFESIQIPDSLAYKITWSIQRRLIEVPVAQAVEFFDKSEHDLLKLMGVPEDWNEYYDISVMFSNGKTGFVQYAGHNGNPYMAYEAGSYMVSFSIKQGINVSETNPNVAWLKKPTTQPPEVEETETPEEVEEVSVSALEAPVTEVFKAEEEPMFVESEEKEEAAVAEVLPVTEIQTVQEQSVEIQPTQSLIEKICGELKNLVCGAQVQTQSYRKYGLRGTL